MKLADLPENEIFIFGDDDGSYPYLRVYNGFCDVFSTTEGEWFSDEKDLGTTVYKVRRDALYQRGWMYDIPPVTTEEKVKALLEKHKKHIVQSNNSNRETNKVDINFDATKFIDKTYDHGKNDKSIEISAHLDAQQIVIDDIKELNSSKQSNGIDKAALGIIDKNQDQESSIDKNSLIHRQAYSLPDLAKETMKKMDQRNKVAEIIIAEDMDDEIELDRPPIKINFDLSDDKQKDSTQKKVYKERRVYFFTCAKCGGSNRQSYKKKRATTAVCKKCRKNAPAENQMMLL